MTIPRGAYPCSLGNPNHRYHWTPRCPDARSGTTSTTTSARSGGTTPRDRAMDWTAKRSDLLTHRPPRVPQFVVKTLFDKETPYSLAADKMLDALPWGRKFTRKLGSHWLCNLLNGAAEALSPNTYAEEFRKDLAYGLRTSGMPEWAAEALAETAKQFATKGVAAALGPTSITDTLRVVGLLVCPDINACPARKEVATTLLKPGVQQMIKDSVA